MIRVHTIDITTAGVNGSATGTGRTKIPVNQIVILIAVDENEPQVFIEKRDNYIQDCMETISRYKEQANADSDNGTST